MLTTQDEDQSVQRSIRPVQGAPLSGGSNGAVDSPGALDVDERVSEIVLSPSRPGLRADLFLGLAAASAPRSVGPSPDLLRFRVCITHDAVST